MILLPCSSSIGLSSPSKFFLISSSVFGGFCPPADESFGSVFFLMSSNNSVCFANSSRDNSDAACRSLNIAVTLPSGAFLDPPLSPPVIALNPFCKARGAKDASCFC